jgi:hypothetical protein
MSCTGISLEVALDKKLLSGKGEEVKENVLSPVLGGYGLTTLDYERI